MISRVSLLAVFSIAAAATGCRIGNYVQHAPQASGYYVTEPTQVTACAALQISNQEEVTSDCAQTGVSSVPEEISAVLSNPVGLTLVGSGSIEGALFNPKNPSNMFPILINGKDKTLSFFNDYDPTPFWRDPACTSQVLFTEEGSYSWYDDGRKKKLDGIEVSGRIALRVEKYVILDGSCAPTLQELSDCYDNVNNCGGATAQENEELYNTVRQYFDRYITAGVMSAADIVHVRAVAYEVLYK